MDGILPGSPSIVHVVQSSLLSTPLLAPRVAFHQFASMRSMILLTEISSEVEVEPHLQPVMGEQFSLASSNTEDGACSKWLLGRVV